MQNLRLFSVALWCYAAVNSIVKSHTIPNNEVHLNDALNMLVTEEKLNAELKGTT